MMRPARRRFGKMVTALLLLPCLSGCAIPFAQQFTTGAGGVSLSTTVAAPTATTSADDVSADGDVSAGAAGGLVEKFEEV